MAAIKAPYVPTAPERAASLLVIILMSLNSKILLLARNHISMSTSCTNLSHSHLLQTCALCGRRWSKCSANVAQRSIVCSVNSLGPQSERQTKQFGRHIDYFLSVEVNSLALCTTSFTLLPLLVLSKAKRDSFFPCTCCTQSTVSSMALPLPSTR